VKKVKLRSPAKIRAKYFLEHVKQSGHAKKYVASEKFLEKFKFSLHRTRHGNFLIDLKRNVTNTPISVALVFNKAKLHNHNEIAYEARVRFFKKKVIVESIQGTKHLTEIRDFEKHTGLPTSRFLLQEIIKQAKQSGYKNVLLRRPETHPSYKKPYWQVELKKSEKILLDKVLFKEANKKEMAQMETIKEKTINTIRTRMKKIYENVATAEGFKRERTFFVKYL
ncbi:MAG: hypothetical protein PHX27_04195, partial [Candidatus ainarchaeum sp.]|nr:hypothetical protein [Candidatus ainarchaeum sp.]